MERAWRSILDSARTTLLDSGFPRSFWALAVQAAVHVDNRLPTCANDGKAPYERYFGRVPDVSHLRRWGCVAHVHIDEGLRNKLESRTRACYFVEYLDTEEGDEREGWLFYEPSLKKFIEGVQVHWYEQHTLRDSSMPWAEHERLALLDWDPHRTDSAIDLVEGVTAHQDHHNRVEAAPDRQDVDEGPIDEVKAHPTHQQGAPHEHICKKAKPVSTGRRSGRTAHPGKTPEHFVPIKGAPEHAQAATLERGESEFSFAAGLAALLATISVGSPIRAILAGAAIDLDLQEADEDVSVAAEIDLNETGVYQALAVKPKTTNDPDSPSIRQALANEDRPAWMAAIGVELEAFAQRGVWDEELVELPLGARGIPLKWVLLVKRDEHGHVLKYKARPACGDLQRPGIDYPEVFSSTIRMSTILTLLALAALKRWDVRRFDVTAAFLHGSLDEKHPLYAKQVPGFEDPRRPHLVRCLRRSLYGLRQAGRKWNETFIAKLKGLGFVQSRADPSLFV